MSLITLKNISTVFGRKPQWALQQVRAGIDKQVILEKHDHIVALNNVSLNIPQGEIFVIMGLSGSGKSTLARHINRLVDPTEGALLIDGTDILKLQRSDLIALRRKRLAMVFQRFGLMPHRKVIDNIAYAHELRGVKKIERRARAAEWMARVGLDGYGHRYPHQLSGGMQQRVGLARALCADTDIIIMDEPFSSLDPLIRRELQDELLRLQKEMGKTIVFITHDLDEAVRLANSLAILKDGELVQTGTSQEVLNNPADDYVAAFVRSIKIIN